MAERTPCLVCGATEGPMCFAGEPYCCENCRKALPPLTNLLAKAISPRPIEVVCTCATKGIGKPRWHSGCPVHGRSYALPAQLAEPPAVTSSAIPVEDLRIGPPPTQVNMHIEGQGLVNVRRVTEELIERRRGRGRGLL